MSPVKKVLAAEMLSVTRVHKNSCWHFQKRRIDVWIQLFVTSLLLFVLSVDSAGVADDSHPVESELFCEKAGGTEPSASWNPTWDSPPPTPLPPSSPSSRCHSAFGQLLNRRLQTESLYLPGAEESCFAIGWWGFGGTGHSSLLLQKSWGETFLQISGAGRGTAKIITGRWILLFQWQNSKDFNETWRRVKLGKNLRLSRTRLFSVFVHCIPIWSGLLHSGVFLHSLGIQTQISCLHLLQELYMLLCLSSSVPPKPFRGVLHSVFTFYLIFFYQDFYCLWRHISMFFFLIKSITVLRKSW